MYCCATNYPKTLQLKTTDIDYPMVAVSQELCSVLAGDLPLALSQTAIKVSARAALGSKLDCGGSRF